MALFIPSVALAHNPLAYVASLGVIFFMSLIITLFLLKQIRKRITIKDKFLKFIALFFIVIGLLFFLNIILYHITVDFLYTIFGG